jgi:hypothetical protein
MATTATAAVLAGACVLLGGCFCAESNTRIHPEGFAPAGEAMKQVIPGKTTAEWLVAALGAPSSKTRLADGTEMYKYEYVETSDSRLQLVPLPQAVETIKTRHRLWFEVRDGVIQRCWRESARVDKRSRIG